MGELVMLVIFVTINVAVVVILVQWLHCYNKQWHFVCIVQFPLLHNFTVNCSCICCRIMQHMQEHFTVKLYFCKMWIF